MIVLTVPNNNPLPHAQLHIIETLSNIINRYVLETILYGYHGTKEIGTSQLEKKSRAGFECPLKRCNQIFSVINDSSSSTLLFMCLGIGFIS